jgi:hypothetical protein
MHAVGQQSQQGKRLFTTVPRRLCNSRGIGDDVFFGVRSGNDVMQQ